MHLVTKERTFIRSLKEKVELKLGTYSKTFLCFPFIQILEKLTHAVKIFSIFISNRSVESCSISRNDSENTIHNIISGNFFN